MPYFASVRNLTRLLFADALLALRAGDTEIALQNARSIQRVGNMNPGMCFLVNSMINVVTTKDFEIHIYALALREGQLSESQLKRLIETSLQRHALADFEWSMHHEIAGGAEVIIQEDELDIIFLSGVVPESWLDECVHNGIKLFSELMPRGWAYMMASRHVYYTSLILEPYDENRSKFDLEAVEETREAIEEMYLEADFFDLLAAMTMPAFEKVTETTLALQCQQDMLGIVCAMELYRQANGALPPSLDVLAPQYIAELRHDPVSGEVYRYERIDNRNYRLWAVGMDGIDNGGIYDRKERHSDQVDIIWPLSSGVHRSAPSLQK